jgi:hypothetical protein
LITRLAKWWLHRQGYVYFVPRHFMGVVLGHCMATKDAHDPTALGVSLPYDGADIIAINQTIVQPNV